MARSSRVGQSHYRDAARHKVLSKRPNFVSKTGLGTLLPVFLQVNLLSFFFTESSIPYRMEEIIPGEEKILEKVKFTKDKLALGPFLGF